jgi:putative transposase
MQKQYVAHKFRLKPDKDQAKILTDWCHTNRYIWNFFLNANKEKHANEKKFIFYHEMAVAIPGLKKQTGNDFLKEPPSQSLQGICQRLETALKRVWQTNNGFPHFKSKKRGDLPSIQIPQSNNQIQWTKQQVKIPKLGWVRWAKHRPLAGKLVSTTTKYEGDHWWVVCLCETTKQTRIGPTDVVGIDLGLKDWIVTSDGEVFNLHPGLLEKEDKVKSEQRKLSKKAKGNNRTKQRRKLQIAYARVRYTRNDNAHKASAAIAKQYSCVAIEDLNIKGMMKNHCLARRIAQVSWGQLINYLSYKTEVKKVNRWYPSSKTCSSCGHKQPMPLDVRIFRCENCQFEIDRDLNAAINIKQITFGQHAAQTACLDSSAIEISTFGTKENHACGDTNTGEEIRSSSRHVSLKQEKGEARSSGSFGLEAYASLARR